MTHHVPKKIVLRVTMQEKFEMLHRLGALLERLFRRRKIFVERKESVRLHQYRMMGEKPVYQAEAGPVIGDIRELLHWEHVVVTNAEVKRLISSARLYGEALRGIYEDTKESISARPQISENGHFKHLVRSHPVAHRRINQARQLYQAQRDG